MEVVEGTVEAVDIREGRMVVEASTVVEEVAEDHLGSHRSSRGSQGKSTKPSEAAVAVAVVLASHSPRLHRTKTSQQ